MYKDDAVFIHVDLKADLSDFENALVNLKNIYFIQRRVDIKWGGYEMVEATVNGFKEIIASGLNIDYVNLLSGQDYPLLKLNGLKLYSELKSLLLIIGNSPDTTGYSNSLIFSFPTEKCLREWLLLGALSGLQFH